INQFRWYLFRHLKRSDFDALGRAPASSWTNVFRRAAQPDTFASAIEELIERLRRLDIHAVYRSHLIMLCRAEGLELPIDHDTRSWQTFGAILSRTNVVTMPRVRVSLAAAGKLGERSEMYVLSPNPRSFVNDQVKTKWECDRAYETFRTSA